MTRPDDDALGVRPADAEPGHRARAYAAALLGELTGRRTVPSEPAARPAADGPAGVPDLAGVTVRSEGHAAAERAAAERDASTTDGTLHDPALGATDERPVDAPVAPPQEQDAALRRPDEEPVLTDTTPPETAPTDTVPSGTAPAGTADGATTDGAAEPLVEPSPPAEAEVRATALRGDAAAPLAGAPVRGDAALTRTAPSTAGAVATGTGTGTAGPRPSPFTYAQVAAHHTAPARARAAGVLDAAGAAISSRAERDAVRRAARTAVEAAALLDACDALDARAVAVDGTWNGERHGATEVREFEAAWGGFYDTSSALSASA